MNPADPPFPSEAPNAPSAPDPDSSLCSVALLRGSPVTLWACPETNVCQLTPLHKVPAPIAELRLCLAPERLVVVGRSTGDTEVPYLDPAYRPTPMLPDGNGSVLLGRERDICVSRAHFTLRGAAGGGVVFTNGVPAVGGGLRSPINGTEMLAPQQRELAPGEEVFIPSGDVVVVSLPNGCTLQLAAR